MISIYPFGDEYFAMTEFPVIHRINPKDLTTEERIDLKGKLGVVNHTAHPHVLPDGTVYNLGTYISKTGPKYCIIEFAKTEGTGAAFPAGGSMFDQARMVASVPTRWKLHPGYMHTFGMTENYFVIVEQPLSVSVTAVVTNTLLDRPLAESLKWYPEEKTIIYLICRKSGRVCRTFHAESFFYLHIINQYEEDDHVVLDICCYKNPSMINCMYIDALKEGYKNPNYASMFRGRPLRFVLPINPTKSEAHRIHNGRIFVKPELLCTLGCETPQIHYEKYSGRKYRYFYAISSDVDLENPGTLIKVDVRNKTRMTWCDDNIFPSEPIFVPRPDSAAEDDGVVLSALVWGRGMENRVGLLILDAHTWTEIGRAVFTTDGPVPKCLHGWFVNGSKFTDDHAS
ncbi:UNVERIFIED_CONTAM: hypothetical protein PYX00_009347 [Menopon gallinae]|uniref:Uncharacterized protein n=1 Tax=Menopon gallinae TaxID=328185 RepID=A0AAW2HBL2_9NEOP